MFRLFYDVRIVNKDGELVTKRRFLSKDKALNFVDEKLIGRRRATVKPGVEFVLVTFENTAWGPAPHDPWVEAPKPISEVFIHHSVTKQLPATATIAEEKEQMRLLDQIAHGRGFNGISYCYVVFPSGRCWEGRGFGIVEAGTEGHNTSGDSIVLAGNYSAFEPTAVVLKAVTALINRAQRDGFFVKAGLNVRAHREVSQTSCPGDNVTAAQIATIQKNVN